MIKIKQKQLKYYLFFILLFGISLFITVYATGSQDEGFRGVIGEEKEVDVWEACQKVTNNNEKDIFIPTRTTEEWQAFRDNATNVALTSCCTDDPECASRLGGEIWCSSASIRAICLVGSDSCLNYSTSYCSYGCSGGNCQSCSVTNTCYSTTCYSNKVWCRDNCGSLDHIKEDCVAKAGTTYTSTQSTTCPSCTIYQKIVDTYGYTGSCSSSHCSSEVINSSTYTTPVTSPQHCLSTPLGGIIFSCPTDRCPTEGATRYDPTWNLTYVCELATPRCTANCSSYLVWRMF